MKIKAGINFINRTTGEEYETTILHSKDIVPQFNFKSSLFNFADVFDFKATIPRGVISNISSHDFVELFYLVDSVKYAIGVGYIEDFVKTVTPNEITIAGNGRDLMGQLLNEPFEKNLYHKSITLADLFGIAAKGEYLEQYARIKKRKGYLVPDGQYQGTFLAVSDATQMKGSILQKYIDLALNYAYQDHNGFIVLKGKINSSDVKARIKVGTPHIQAYSIKMQYSSVYSHATVFYNSSESQVNGETPSPKIINTDPRVVNKITRPFLDTFDAVEIKDFAGQISAEERIKQKAKHELKKSNRNLFQLIITTDLPFYLDYESGHLVPYHLGDVWEIESEFSEFKTATHPNGTNIAKVVLTDIDCQYSEESGFSYQLSLFEPETVL